jgi:hypothetical protein
MPAVSALKEREKPMANQDNIFNIRYYRHSSIVNPIQNEEIGNDIKIHRLTVELINLPLGMSNENNAREAKINKSFHKEIKNSIVNSEVSDFTPGLFNLRNSGIVIVAESAQVVDQNILSVNFGSKGSIIDGGHTYKILTSIIEECDQADIPEEYVQIEIITGLNKAVISEITEARNTSQKHQLLSLQNQGGRLDWLKKAIDGTPGLPDFSEKVAWYQNDGAEDNLDLTVDGAYIIKILTACDIFEWPNGSQHPIASYNSKEKAVARHKNKQQNYTAMKDVVLDICRLHDLMILEASKWYNVGTVHKIFDAKKTNADKLIFLQGQQRQQLLLSNKILVEAFAYPMLSAIRQLMKIVDTDEGPKIVWREGYSLSKVSSMLDDGLGLQLLKVAYQEMGGHSSERMSINHVCKDKNIWSAMYSVVADYVRDNS